MLRRLIRDVAVRSSERLSYHSAACSSTGAQRRAWEWIAVIQSASFSTELKTSLLNASPKSLASDRVIAEPHPGVEQNFFTKALLQIGGFYTRESKLLRGAKAWYQCVVEQSDDKELNKAFSLQDNFADRYALLCVHMWLCLVRLRAEGKDGKDLAQIVYESFTDDVEVRVRAAGVKVRISKHLTDLEQMFYGTSLAYDQVHLITTLLYEALDGKEELSAAVLRNVYGNKPERRKDADLLARYIKRELACLSMTDSEAVMKGSVSFSRDFLGS